MKTIFTLFFVFLFLVTKGQNLVPNSSFETLTSCPNNQNQVGKATPWFNPSFGTPDLLNECVPFSVFLSIPQNTMGYQYARTGVGYVDVFVYDSYQSISGRDYVSVKLNTSLISGRKYAAGFYTSVAVQDSLWNLLYPTTGSVWAIDQMGLLFTDTAINLTNNLPIPSATPQIANPIGHFLADTLNWMVVKGIYNAIGNEQYITIGNFKDNAHTNALQISNTSMTFGSYYFIDDVFVYDVTDLQTANAGNSQVVCKGNALQIGMPTDTGYTYHWQPAIGLSNDSISNPIANPSVTTTYYLTVNYQGYYETKDSITITVNNCEDTIKDDIFIPNIFSPNGDLNNDVFYVRSHTIAEMTFCIYNRWGEKVFESKDINKGWDGTYKNEKCNTGVFVYYLEATLIDGRKVGRQGNVTLVR